MLRFSNKSLFVITTGIGAVAFVCQFAVGSSLQELAKNLVVFYTSCAIMAACLIYGRVYGRYGLIGCTGLGMLIVIAIWESIGALDPPFMRWLGLHALTTALVVWQLLASLWRVDEAQEPEESAQHSSAKLLTAARDFRRAAEPAGSSPMDVLTAKAAQSETSSRQAAD